ncbi:ArsR/SmtB family transcription factor [Natrialba swarupiae]|uniref:Helix-turn-helix transcriptional regulator n=1 Tax=Natrialba swarupiae TaxID=2448032 RepID=A0A5D5AJI1_9EURY|nr:helix-turn-helix domain-containing protein [Natrialba swarupiae]MCW8172198.1 ArsR family transcriptional regulator [Natrialba swarupiae]TYT61103.1 helix-turn-helix transcriptional regulator [Natrialba swarupiae]
MSRLLPTTTNASTERTGDPSLLCIDDDRTSEVLAALSSETARDIFRELNERPLTAAALADRLDMSIQSVSYHLENLSETGLIDVADTCYSEKGREMDVYAVSDEPLVLFLGTEDDQPRLRVAFKNLAVAVGPVSILIAVWETLARYVGASDAA